MPGAGTAHRGEPGDFCHYFIRLAPSSAVARSRIGRTIALLNGERGLTDATAAARPFCCGDAAVGWGVRAVPGMGGGCPREPATPPRNRSPPFLQRSAYNQGCCNRLSSRAMKSIRYPARVSALLPENNFFKASQEISLEGRAPHFSS